MSDEVIAALIGLAAGFIGGLMSGFTSIFETKRTIPSYRRNRIKVDLEIYEKTKALELNVPEVKKYIEVYVNGVYKKWLAEDRPKVEPNNEQPARNN